MRHIITLIVVYCALVFVARTQVLYQVHCPHNGDRVTKTGYEWMDFPSDTTVWDMSHAVETGESREMRWRVLGDSIFVRTESGAQYTYRMHGDTLWHTSSENRLTQLRDSVPCAFLHFPFLAGDTLRSPFYHHGRYSGNNAVAAAGWSTIEGVAVGTLILPSDTVSGVLLVQQTCESRVRVSPFAEAAPISYETDSLLRHVERQRWWYAPGYRYPLAESRESVFLSGAAVQGRNHSMHLCSPAEQEYALGAMPNEAMRNPSMSPSLRYDAGDLADTSPTVLPGELSVSRQDGGVEVTYTPEEDCRMEMVLTDALGRVFAARQSQSVSSGQRNISRLSTAGLPAGVYLLYIGNGKQRQVERITVE